MSGWSFDRRIANHVPDRDLVAPATRSTRESDVSGFRQLPSDFMTSPNAIGGSPDSPTHRTPYRIITSREATTMARETVYVVQAYIQGKRARLNADTPIRCKSPESARKTAERLAATKAGVVAFSTSGDADLGEYDDEPTLFFKAGHLPTQFQDR